MNSKKRHRQNGKNYNTYKWVIWGILVVIYLIAFFHRLSVGVITEDLNKSFGMTASQIANLGAMYFYSYIIMQIPAGVLADYLGPKKTVVIGTLLTALGSIIFSFSTNIIMAYSGRLLVGLGASVTFLCLLKIQSSWFPAEKFATMSGLSSFIGSLGGLFAQTPLIALISIIGWRGSFFAMGIVTLIMAILAVLFVRNTPIEMGFLEVNPKEAKNIGEKQSITSQLLEVIKNPKVWYVSFVFGGVNGGFLVFTGTFGISYITSVYGFSNTYAANIISIVLLFAGISCILIGGISDKLKRRKLPIIILAGISVVAWTILAFLKPPVFLMFILVTLIGVTSSVAVLSWSIGKEVSNPKLSGISMSIVNAFGFSFTAILMIVCGKIIDLNIKNGLSAAVAYPRAFLAVVISSVIALIFAFLTAETKCENIYLK